LDGFSQYLWILRALRNEKSKWVAGILGRLTGANIDIALKAINDQKFGKTPLK